MSELNGKRIHIIGIGGTGMSPIAFVLVEAGAIVSGSDRSRSDIVSKLETAGIPVHIGHKAENIGDAELVLYSSAIPNDNPELVEARNQKIPTKRRNEFLSTLLSDREVIAIAGTHGKTTTTSMMSWVLTDLGENPGFIIGSTPKNLQTNAKLGGNLPFVIEADEYDNMFLGLNPAIAIVIRIEHDHPDFFPTEQSYYDAFRKFLSQVKPNGVILMNADDPKQDPLKQELRSDIRIYTYGTSENADFRALKLQKMVNGCYRYEFKNSMTNETVPVELSVSGTHNVLNATAVLACCAISGLNVRHASESIHTFSGIARRFEIVGFWNDITIIDDYAHHPTEIQATLQAARDVYLYKRIWALWQPHTFSRTKALLPEFCESFSNADVVLITNIYASREKQSDFGFEDLKKAMLENHPNVQFAETNSAAVAMLTEQLQPGDVVVTLSAGDANLIGIEALDNLKDSASHHPVGTILRNEPISRYSSALCGGPAKELVMIDSTEQLIAIIRDCQLKGKPYKVVGGLSNILFSDEGYDGLLIINCTNTVSFEPSGGMTLATVGSGMPLDVFVRACAENSLTGLEWATKIPGTVGGSIYGNAGAYGGVTASVLQHVQFLDTEGNITTIKNADLGFGYRSSKLKRGELSGTILSGTYALTIGDYGLIQEKMAEIAEKRQKFNFRGNGSLGSVFRNPEGDYAGRLISAIGYCGKSFGKVEILDHHGNIFITYPGVKSSEFAAAIREVHDAVQRKFGIDLLTEIEILKDRKGNK